MNTHAGNIEYIQIATELAGIQHQVLQPTTLSRSRYADLMLQRDRLIKRFWVALLAFGIESARDEVQRQAVRQFAVGSPSDGWSTYSPAESTDEEKQRAYERMHDAAVQGIPFDAGGGYHTRIT